MPQNRRISFSVLFLFLNWSRAKILKCSIRKWNSPKMTFSDYGAFQENYANAITWQNHLSNAFWGISCYLPYLKYDIDIENIASHKLWLIIAFDCKNKILIKVSFCTNLNHHESVLSSDRILKSKIKSLLFTFDNSINPLAYTSCWLTQSDDFEKWFRST